MKRTKLTREGDVAVCETHLYDMYDLWNHFDENKISDQKASEKSDSWSGMGLEDYMYNLKHNKRIKNPIDKVKTSVYRKDKDKFEFENKYNIQTGKFSVPRVINNHPLSRVKRAKSRTKNVFRIAVNLVANAGYTERQFSEFAEKILHFYETNRKSNVHCEIKIFVATKNLGRENIKTFLWIRLPQNLTYAEITHVLSVSTLRRFEFKYCETLVKEVGGYGQPYYDFDEKEGWHFIDIQNYNSKLKEFDAIIQDGEY